MRYTDLMMDCETLDTEPGAVVLSIGLVLFGADDWEPEEIEVVYQRWDPREQLRLGGSVSYDTLAWWSTQSDDARDELFAPGIQFEPLSESLATIHEWLNTLSDDDWGALRVWANGAGDDPGWVEHWYRRIGSAPPWEFRQVRDCRTLWEMARLLGWGWPSRPTHLVRHRADHDAIAQAHRVASAWQFLRGTA